MLAQVFATWYHARMTGWVRQSKEVAMRHEASAPDPLRVLPPVTEKQGKCLRFILDYFLENRFYPTQRELATAMSVRSNTAEMYLQPLEQKGYLQREPGKQRNIRLTPDGLERLKLMGVNLEERLAAA
jgi:DNA-binding MarR family transcriptional regulator